MILEKMSSILEELLKLSPILIEIEEAKVLLAKTIGYSIIVGSSLIKLPQLLKIVQAKSAVGINFWAQVMELCAYTFTCSYGYARMYPFSSWGESGFLLFETLLICMAVLFFSNKRITSMVFATVYLSA